MPVLFPTLLYGLLFSVVLSLEPPQPVPVPAAASVSSELTAIACGVAAWERSVRSVESEEVLWQMAGPESAWLPSLKALRGYESEYSWYVDATQIGAETSPQATGLHLTRYGRTVALNRAGDVGVAREMEWPLLQASKSIPTLMGRHVDLVAYRSLEQLIRESSDVHYLMPDGTSAYPGLRLKMPTPRTTDGTLVLRVDPKNGFVPRAIEVWNDLKGLPSEFIEVVEVQQVAGVFLPVAGVFTNFTHQICDERGVATDDRLPTAMKRLQLTAGPPNGREDATVAVFRRLAQRLPFRSTIIPDLCAYPPIEDTGTFLSPVVVQAKVQSVNRGFVHLDRRIRELDSRKVYDGMRSETINLGRWLQEPVEEAAPSERTPDSKVKP